MFTYFKMKYKEWKVKLICYSTALSLFENNREIAEFLKNIYEVLKDVPASDLQNELIKAIAGLVHEEAQKGNENE